MKRALSAGVLPVEDEASHRSSDDSEPAGDNTKQRRLEADDSNESVEQPELREQPSVERRILPMSVEDIAQLLDGGLSWI